MNQKDNRDAIIAQRRAEVEELYRLLTIYTRYAVVFIRYPGTTPKVKDARRKKAMIYGVQAMMLKYRILTIISQPIPKYHYNPGAPVLQTFIGEDGPEVIEIKDGKIFRPEVPIILPRFRMF